MRFVGYNVEGKRVYCASSFLKAADFYEYLHANGISFYCEFGLILKRYYVVI